MGIEQDQIPFIRFLLKFWTAWTNGLSLLGFALIEDEINVVFCSIDEYTSSISIGKVSGIPSSSTHSIIKGGKRE